MRDATVNALVNEVNAFVPLHTASFNAANRSYSNECARDKPFLFVSVELINHAIFTETCAQPSILTGHDHIFVPPATCLTS